MAHTKQQTLSAIKNNGIIAIVRGVENQYLIPLFTALKEGGVLCAEITFGYYDDEQTFEQLKEVCARFGDEMYIGAGTVLDTKKAELAFKAGAEFLVTPTIEKEVIDYCNKNDKIMISGAYTPTEINYAYNLGSHLVKLFPADSLGAKYIKSVKAPLIHIPIVCFGGINASNIGEYVRAGAIGAGIGSDLVNLKAIKSGDFESITLKAKELVLAINQAKGC
ncbi:MAG: bifunctional 4-hydroxy-2-oxoglutarate aldolase/2-dehydro-3-deoxy-phosphogluconate aldolase [Clostridia bacterium]|nr:bifunctional 4-hydroxy-2-oxoglutarate aldolase/2-dehydro-3-deoxy-phosphogluconate aldolase [Clostridia bacterium]